MIPITFNGCFGWLHNCQNEPVGDVAVLICQGLHHDGIDSYQGLRVLADRLAANGYPTMRYDYPGTGNSIDINQTESPGRDMWTSWQDSVDDAIDRLIAFTGAKRIVLCGLRLGATLAVSAASRRREVAGCMLLAPMLKGQSNLLQLWIESKLQNEAAPPMSEGVRVPGLYLSSQTVRLMRAIDLRKICPRKGQNILICLQAPNQNLEECTDAWGKQGVGIQRIGFQGMEPLLQPNLNDDKESPNFAPLIDWMRRSFPYQNAPAPAAMPEPAVLRLPGCVEVPLKFGADQKLFGILCQPVRNQNPVVVLIGNTGRDPHHGTARFSVEFARRLATEGIASLRMDFAGLGDSIGPPGAEDILGAAMDLDRVPDIRAALDMLQEIGFQRFAAYGLCAGAYHMLQGAVADTRIETLLLVNIPCFTWRTGERIRFARNKTRPFSFFISKYLNFKSWPVLLGRRQKVLSVLRGQIERTAGIFRERFIHIGRQMTFSEAASQLKGRLSVTALSMRGARTLFLFAPDDVGTYAVDQEFGDKMPLDQFVGVTVEHVTEFDHILSTDSIRRVACDKISNFLSLSLPKVEEELQQLR